MKLPLVALVSCVFGYFLGDDSRLVENSGMEKRAVVIMSMTDEIRRAEAIIKRHTNLPLTSVRRRRRKSQIPQQAFKDCKGIAIMTSIHHAEWGFGASMGTGIIMRKLGTGLWSAPSSFRSVGIDGVAQGLEITDYVIFLHSNQQVDRFTKTKMTMGGRASISFFAGKSKERKTGNMTIYAYSRGMFIGIGPETNVIYQADKVNTKFYGKKIKVETLLSGNSTKPKEAKELYNLLKVAEGV